MRTRPRLAGSKQPLADPAERRYDLVGRLVTSDRDLFDRLGRIEQVLPGEFSLRVVRCVAGRFNPELSASNRSVLPKQTRDLLVGPDVERAFGLMRSGRLRLLGGQAV